MNWYVEMSRIGVKMHSASSCEFDRLLREEKRNKYHAPVNEPEHKLYSCPFLRKARNDAE